MAMFLASLAALTDVRIVHYILVNCLFACFYLLLKNFELAFDLVLGIIYLYIKRITETVYVDAMGLLVFAIDLAVIAISMLFFDVKE